MWLGILLKGILDVCYFDSWGKLAFTEKILTGEHLLHKTLNNGQEITFSQEETTEIHKKTRVSCFLCV